MTLRTSLPLAALCLIAACATAPGIDRPVPLDADYAVREAGASEPHDRCGPEFIQERLPGFAISMIGPVTDGPFRQVCERHDACYRLREKTQAWCDDRMRTEMMDICAAGRSGNSLGGALCRLRARLYFSSVDNTFGAYAYEGEAGGRISSLAIAETSRRRTEICVTAENDTMLMQEYVIELYDTQGRRLARRPRFHERNIRAGDSADICASVPRSDGRRAIDVRLVADRPDTFETRNDMIIVDRRGVILAPPRAD